MNLRYFILTIALIPSIAYTAEIAPKKEDRTLKHQKSSPKQRENSVKKKESSSKQLKKHPKKESQAVLLDKPKPSLEKKLSFDNREPQNTVPVATHIYSMTMPLTFNGKTQSLYEWLKNSETNKFGPTRVIEAQQENYRLVFHDKGTVSKAEEPEKIRDLMATRCALYISNLEKSHSTNYGAFVLQNTIGTEKESERANAINYLTDSFLLWFIAQQPKKSKKLDDKKKDKKKEELIEVNAECNEAAAKALEALQ